MSVRIVYMSLFVVALKFFRTPAMGEREMGPPANLGLGLVGTWKLLERSPVAALQELETVGEKRDLLAELVKVARRATSTGGGVEAIERVPVIDAAKQTLFEGHAKALLRTELVTAEALPRLVAGHTLKAGEVTGRAAVVEVKVLLLATVDRRDTRHNQRVDDARQRQLLGSVHQNSAT